MKINILGTAYSVVEKSEQEDRILKECDGYCDKTTKEIVIVKQVDDSDLGCWEWYRKKVLRHEIVHAFLFESGLHGSINKSDGEHDEQMVDWIAVQSPKMFEAFKEAGCL